MVMHRTCPSGKSGGSLGEFGPGQMVKEFNDVVFTTGKVGKVPLAGPGPFRLPRSPAVARLPARCARDLTGARGLGVQVEGPVKTQFGYHLILITKRGDESM